MEIYINLTQMAQASYVVDTTIHELAHHKSGGAEDGSEQHLGFVSKLAGDVVESTAKGAFDEILRDPAFMW